MFSEIRNVNIMMFADDCVLYSSGRTWPDIHLRLQAGLDKYIAWGNEHNLTLNAKKSKAMILCSRTKRDCLGSPAPFNVGNSKISFVNNFRYLGCILDHELTMVPAYNDIHRKVEHKNYMLGKIRYLLDKKSALLVYKQTVLPFLDYVGFVLLSCNIGLRRELQILQNNALRLCLRYRLADRVSIQRLHLEANLQSVEQRGIFQLLKLLYGYSRNRNHLKAPIRLTRAGTKVVFDIPTKCTDKYLNSPLYKGSQIWDLLPENVQRSDTLKEFIRYTYYCYAEYRNLLP